MSRVFRALHVHYRLASPHSHSTTTQDKRWYFELPAARDDTTHWTELLHRLFYDANVGLRRREPGDLNWLALDHFELAAIDADLMLDWPGIADLAHAERHMPWQLSATIWEFASCLYVDDEGRYDGMTGNDFCELIALRMLDAGRADAARVLAFLSRLYPQAGQRVFDKRATRLANLACVRPPDQFGGAFRKAPGEPPLASGPPRADHLAIA